MCQYRTHTVKIKLNIYLKLLIMTDMFSASLVGVMDVTGMLTISFANVSVTGSVTGSSEE